MYHLCESLASPIPVILATGEFRFTDAVFREVILVCGASSHDSTQLRLLSYGRNLRQPDNYIALIQGSAAEAILATYQMTFVTPKPCAGPIIFGPDWK